MYEYVVLHSAVAWRQRLTSPPPCSGRRESSQADLCLLTAGAWHDWREQSAISLQLCSALMASAMEPRPGTVAFRASWLYLKMPHHRSLLYNLLFGKCVCRDYSSRCHKVPELWLRGFDRNRWPWDEVLHSKRNGCDESWSGVYL